MLEEQNPWWFSDNWEKEDYQLERFRSQKIRWIPKWIDEISLKPFSLNFVYGPRQVGKTTGIKLLIKRLIDKGVDPKDIVYVNCDFLVDLRHMMNILKEICDKKYIFLDEVTSLENWWKPLKGFIDLGKLKSSSVTVTGSSSLRIKKYIEAFPGRKGFGKKIEVLPLSFPDFLEVNKIKKYGIELEKGFKKYLEVGGFPRSINEDKSFFVDLIDSVDKEVEKIGKDHRIARKVIITVIKKAPSAISYFSIGKEIELNHVTTREYLHALEDLYLLKIVFLKINDKVFYRKEKKIFLRDPYLARVYCNLFDLECKKDFLYEWIVQEHLYRKFGEIYYYKNKYEIDCLAGNLKIEVKAGKPHRRYPRNVKILEEEDIPMFLLELFQINAKV